MPVRTFAVGKTLVALAPEELKNLTLGLRDGMEPHSALKESLSRFDTKRKINFVLRNIDNRDVYALKDDVDALIESGVSIVDVGVLPLRRNMRILVK